MTLTHSDGLPILQLPEEVPVLWDLIHFCYGAFPSIADSKFLDSRSKSLVSLIRAATTYRMHKVITAARLMMQQFLTIDPLQAFFVAVACGWSKEASDAAEQCYAVSGIDHRYVAQMENCPAKPYHVFMEKYILQRKMVALQKEQSSSSVSSNVGADNTRANAPAATRRQSTASTYQPERGTVPGQFRSSMSHTVSQGTR